MKLPVFLAVCLFFLQFSQLWSADSEDNYGSAADYLNKIYGSDDNAGLTAFPVLNVPMGGRSEGMASAFAAAADDASFIEFNPAGSSTLDKSELAFFHNNWIADTKLEGVVFTTRFENFGLAAAAKWMYTPFTEYNMYGERVSNGYYSEGEVILNASYNFFSGYYFGGLSLGVNLKGAFRIMPDFTGNDEATNEDVIIDGSGMSQSAVMGMADVGLLARFNMLKYYSSRDKNASIALVLRNLGPPSKGEPLPTVFNAAISYRPLRPLMITFDFNLPMNLTDIKLSEKPYFALGLSANVTNFLSLRAGVLVKAGSSRVSVGSAIILNKIAIDINYTLDLLTQGQPLNRISLGVRFDLGDGGRRQKADKVEELYLLGMDAYARGDFIEAKNYFEEALQLNPKFDPAKESLSILNNREDINRRIEDLYKLD